MYRSAAYFLEQTGQWTHDKLLGHGAPIRRGSFILNLRSHCAAETSRLQVDASGKPQRSSQTLSHFIEMYSNGQWRAHYGNDSDFAEAVREATRLFDYWTDLQEKSARQSSILQRLKCTG
jgi:hypothetical protein